jgi:tetratricopeptide (TPR) repeat protein
MNKLILSLALLLNFASHADPVTITAIENASMELNLNQLLEVQRQSYGYDQALANYRLGLNYSFTGKHALALESLKLAINQLKNLVKNDPQDVESWALLSQVYGLNIAFQPIKGTELGPKSEQALDKAKKIAPNNPRVLLISGIGKYNTPAMFGGSKQLALIELNQAIMQYKNNEHSNYPWGFAEAYTWRGLTQLELGNKAEALADWKKAIEISPNYGWAKNLLRKNS